MKHVTVPAVVNKLMEARERLRKGWCQGQYTNSNSDYCPLGAVYIGVSIGRPSDEPVRYLSHAIPHDWSILIPHGKEDHGNRVIYYADHPRRTHAEILALCDRAIGLALGDASS